MAGPACRRSQGRNSAPSFKKRKDSTSTSTNVTTPEVTALTPVKTPAAICSALRCSRSTSCAVSSSIR